MTISVCIVAYNRDAMLARTAPALEASARTCGEEVERVVLTEGPQPFSAGAWRTMAANASKGEILVMLDADMLVPPDFLVRMAAIVRAGRAAFPLYMREDHPGGRQSPGNGWGNAAFSREVWTAVAAAYNGHPYPETTRWGHEDVAFAKRVHRLVPFWRELVPGFVHLWHPKTGSQWYGAPGVGGVQRGEG
jgi:glycosyltransferase involved in cell wall biosynthesis